MPTDWWLAASLLDGFDGFDEPEDDPDGLEDELLELLELLPPLERRLLVESRIIWSASPAVVRVTVKLEVPPSAAQLF